MWAYFSVKTVIFDITNVFVIVNGIIYFFNKKTLSPLLCILCVFMNRSWTFIYQVLLSLPVHDQEGYPFAHFSQSWLFLNFFWQKFSMRGYIWNTCEDCLYILVLFLIWIFFFNNFFIQRTEIMMVDSTLGFNKFHWASKS